MAAHHSAHYAHAAASVQERKLLESGADWRQAYYMPGESDTGISSWRSWLQRFGAAMPILPHR